MLDGKQARQAANAICRADSRVSVARENEVPAAVLLPAALARLGAEWLFFAKAAHVNAVRRNACCNQCILHCVGTFVAERQVVLRGTALVRVALDGDAPRRFLRQRSCICSDGLLRI